MSVPSVVIECSACDYQVPALQTVGAFSWCDDRGNRASLTRELGVCHDCGGVVAIEKLPTDREIREMLSQSGTKDQAKLSDRDKEPTKEGWFSRIFGGQKRKSQNTRMDNRPEWLRVVDELAPKEPGLVLRALAEQQRKPICLVCGGVEVQPLNLPKRHDLSETLEYSTGIEHPRCGGMLMAFFPRNKRYSPFEYATLVHLSGKIVRRERYR